MLNLYRYRSRLFLFGLCVVPIAAAAQTTCHYTLRLLDSAGDGWGGSFVRVGVGPPWVETDHTLVTGSLYEVDIEVAYGNTIVFEYVANGPDQWQNTIELEFEGVSWQYGPEPTPGVFFANAVSCDTWPLPIADCGGAFWVCVDGAVDQLMTQGVETDLDAVNTGCLAGETRGAWYKINFSQAGTAQLTLEPRLDMDPNARVDFAIWGPYFDPEPFVAPCPGEAPIRCSVADVIGNKGLVIGATDLTQDATGNGWLMPLDVTPGSVYVLYVDDPSNGAFLLDFDLPGPVVPSCIILSTAAMPEQDEQVRLYPNPVEDHLMFQWMARDHGTLTWRVICPVGRILMEGRDQGIRTIDVAGLAAGQYLLELSAPGNEATSVARFVKQ